LLHRAAPGVMVGNPYGICLSRTSFAQQANYRTKFLKLIRLIRDTVALGVFSADIT